MIDRLRRSTLTWVWALMLVACVGPAPGRGETLSRPVRVGALEDSYPFSYLGADGKIVGFSADLLDEVCSVMGITTERKVGPTAAIHGEFRAGRIDLLQAYAQFPEREATADFSVPYLTMEGVVFVAANRNDIRSLEDLRGRRVLVHRGSLGEAVLRKAGLGAEVVYVKSVEEGLEMVDRGEGDATLASRLSGLAIAYHRDLKNLSALNFKVPGYEVRYCFGVQEGDRELLARLNEGLAVLVKTGRFDRLYQQWFGHIAPSGYTGEQVMLAVSVGLAVALVIAIWAVLRQRTMRYRLARQADALSESEDWHRQIFEGTRDGLLVLRPPGETGAPIVERANPAALQLLGRTVAPAKDEPLAGLLHAEPGLAEKIAAALPSVPSGGFDYERPAGAGWLQVTLSPLRRNVLVSLVDITEQKHAAESLRRQQEQLGQSQRLEAIGTLAGGIAHDFNNLLTGILGNTELALMTLPAQLPETAQLQQVLKAGRRAQQLVQQILAFSRQAEGSRQVLAPGPIIDETIGFLQAVCRGAVEFEQRRGSQVPNIEADAGQVHQVLMNIGTNAVHAMRGQTPGRLQFILDRVVVDPAHLVPSLAPGEYLRIGVQDNGPGMTEAVKARIFEPFFSTKPRGEGSGLGLSVVHGIMQQNRGAVVVETSPGKGTLFQLYFPAVHGEVAASDAAAIETLPRGQGQRILLVDDDAFVRETLGKMLERLGYAVTAHEAAAPALAEFKAQPERFAVILSDLTMPNLTGLQLAGAVRAIRPGVPFLLVSGFFLDAERAEARRLGAIELVQKPVGIASVGRLIATVLRGS